MSRALFLVDALPDGPTYQLGGAEGHHAADVARLRPGEGLLLGDGAGGLAECTVTATDRGRLDLRVDAVARQPVPRPWLVVAQALAKGDRGELAVQAMTEAGVDEIVPWTAARSVVRWRAERGARALARWRSVAREAGKQSRRARLPVVAEPTGTAGLAARLAAADGAYVLHEAASTPLATIPLPAAAGELLLVVGPEGGICDEELAAFAATGCRPVRLGHHVLRTSTAGVAALSVLNVRTDRWS